jgi:DNA invertase Pin-like site-specific DNA recombinase
MVEIRPEKRLIGCARVSTVGQTLDSQLEQLRAAGCDSRNIYKEKATGARPDRRELNRMLGKLAPNGRGSTVSPARPSTCSVSSSASWTPTRNSDPWLNHGPTLAPAPGD